MAAQLGQVPAVTAEDADLHSREEYGVELACHGEDERGFAATVRAEDGHMLAGANSQVDVVQHHSIAARHIYVAQRKKLTLIRKIRVLGHPTLTC